MGHTLLPTTGKGTRDGRGRAYAPSGRGNPPKVVPPHQPQQATGWARAVATFPRNLEDGCSQSSALGSTHSRRPQRRSQPAAATHGRHTAAATHSHSQSLSGRSTGGQEGGGSAGAGAKGARSAPRPRRIWARGCTPSLAKGGPFSAHGLVGPSSPPRPQGGGKERKHRARGRSVERGGTVPHTLPAQCAAFSLAALAPVAAPTRRICRRRRQAAAMATAAAAASSDDMWQRPEGGTPVAAATVAAVAVAGASTAAVSGSDGSGGGSRRG
ncbi:hypothetical protein I4F81_009615 [Pyropia yezoensis]|uniref:Uncharacterized protein n=1 Tax=Pyropia yezoensis TaxID=2788 RepID=A0ACC3CA32_PYRYE|nr:hypothetical protein I4F81_009615 [Neopyropia yezoensis]